MNDILKTYPVQVCEWEEKNGLITVLVKKPLNLIEKIFFKKMMDKPFKVDLDEIGSFVWKNCTGDKSVEDIVQLCKEEFGDKVEPAEGRVKLFIEQLNKNKMIRLFMKVSGDDDV